MVKEHKYTMLFKEGETERLKEWGKEQGFSSLAKLIEASLDVVQRRPVLLQPLEDTTSADVLSSVKESVSVFGELSEALSSISNRLTTLERGHKLIAKKLDITDKEYKEEVEEVDLSDEAVFE